MDVSDDILVQFKRDYGFGVPQPLGFGKRPVVLVVDYIEGFTNPESPLSANWDEPVENTIALIEAAYGTGIRTVFTTVEYEASDLDTNILIAKASRVGILMKGSRWTQVDHRLPRHEGDIVVTKKFGSAFFDTGLAAELNSRNVDTILIAGCVTSGCVRATAVDAAQHGFRPMVVRDAVGDRSPLAQAANLCDIELRFGDVVSLDEAASYLCNLS